MSKLSGEKCDVSWLEQVRFCEIVRYVIEFMKKKRLYKVKRLILYYSCWIYPFLENFSYGFDFCCLEIRIM